MSELPASKYTTMTLTFNARTGVNSIHNVIDPRLKRKKMNVLGLEGNKSGLIFIDDLNMPKKEIFGAQPALELVRQYFDYKGW